MTIRYRNVVVLLILGGLSVWTLAGEKTVPLVDDSSLPAPKAGTLIGRITPAKNIRTLQAVSRATEQRYLPTKFDDQTGRFEFADMPGGAVYDLCVTTRDGREIEGIDLSFVDERLQRLADKRREQLGAPAARPAGAFTKRDAQAILKFIRERRDFMDTRRVLYLQGRGDRATVLVELLRLREFHHAKQAGEQAADIVWRMELWYFVQRGGGWERLANMERVLRRVRAKPGEWRKISVEYDPRLSMRIDEAGKSQPLSFTLPAKPDPTRGRPANTPAKLKTKPHVVRGKESEDRRQKTGDRRQETGVRSSEDRVAE